MDLISLNNLSIGELSDLPITIDSRIAKSGVIFVALNGITKNSQNGHNFIKQALANNCSGLVLQRSTNHKLELPKKKPVWLTKNSRIAAAILAEKSMRIPSKNIILCGITGTNGKTTVSFFLSSMVESFGRKIGIIGTLGVGSLTKLRPCKFTTPESEHISSFLAHLVNENYEQVVMEVSSHAIATHRIEGLNFKVAALTNITHDHLDFHKNLFNYKRTKLRFLSELLPDNGTAVLPEILIKKNKFKLRSNIISWGYSESADIQASQIRNTETGIKYNLRIENFKTTIESKICGMFNLSNMLCAIGMAVATGISINSIIDGICNAALPEGRLQKISNSFKPTVFVDFAHTPNALEVVLKNLRNICKNRLIIVFGCGGERDRKKRPLMAKIAIKYADEIFVTQDNPRFEDQNQIINDMQLLNFNNVHVIHDRRSAIKYAINIANFEDIVLITGKGHEKTQQIGDQIIEFNDAEIAREILFNRFKNSNAK